MNQEKPPVSESTLAPHIFVYREITGPFHQAMPLFKELTDFLTADFLGNWMTVMPTYDNPQFCAEENLRWGYGFLTQECESEEVEKFLAKHDQFKSKVTHQVNIVQSNWYTHQEKLYENVIPGVYHAVGDHAMSKGYLAKDTKECTFMELYSGGQDFRVKVMYIYGEHRLDYFVTTKPFVPKK